MFPKIRQKRFMAGLIDPLSIAVVVILAVSALVGTFVVQNRSKSLDIRNKAATCGGCENGTIPDGFAGGCNSNQGGKQGFCTCDHWTYDYSASCPNPNQGNLAPNPGPKKCSGGSPTASCCLNQNEGGVSCGGVSGTCTTTQQTSDGTWLCSFTYSGACTPGQFEGSPMQSHRKRLELLPKRLQPKLSSM